MIGGEMGIAIQSSPLFFLILNGFENRTALLKG